MARTIDIPKGIRQRAVTRSLIVLGRQDMQFEADVNAADYFDDPALRGEIIIERSRDGVVWEPMLRATVSGGKSRMVEGPSGTKFRRHPSVYIDMDGVSEYRTRVEWNRPTECEIGIDLVVRSARVIDRG